MRERGESIFLQLFENNFEVLKLISKTFLMKFIYRKRKLNTKPSNRHITLLYTHARNSINSDNNYRPISITYGIQVEATNTGTQKHTHTQTSIGTERQVKLQLIY